MNGQQKCIIILDNIEHVLGVGDDDRSSEDGMKDKEDGANETQILSHLDLRVRSIMLSIMDRLKCRGVNKSISNGLEVISIQITPFPTLSLGLPRP